jgi:hypothetical protein
MSEEFLFKVRTEIELKNVLSTFATSTDISENDKTILSIIIRGVALLADFFIVTILTKTHGGCNR